MTKNYVFTGESATVVISDGEVFPIELKGNGSDEIKDLIEQRRALGKLITQKLKENGFAVAGDEATEVVSA